MDGRDDGADMIRGWMARDRKAHIDRVTTDEDKRKAEMLLGTFEHVSRQEASRITEVRRVFQRALCLSNHEAGWNMQHVGVDSIMNCKKVRIAVSVAARAGLKIPTQTEGCTQCPMCGYCWRPNNAAV